MKSEPFVCSLVAAKDLSQVGGKAVNLSRLIAAGLDVPDGFVITTAAFREADGSNSVPNQVATEIQMAYEKMGSPMVAARSSATAEDLAEASMAGQYDTFLNLSGITALLEAVARCWQSTKSDRLRAYLLQQGICPDRVEMAVIVQRLIPAEVAGVLFTADPNTGSTEEMLVEAAWGLGEGVVSGKVQPDRIRLKASDTSVIDYHVSEKSTYLRPGAKDFEEVATEARSRACLRYESLYRLRDIGRQAERHFHGPQDIEWAMADGRMFVLQSRPITTLREAKLRHELPDAIRRNLTQQAAAKLGPWVRHNLDETLQQPTPLTWSVLKPFMSGQGSFGRMYEHIGFQPSDAVREQGFLELIGGRIYMDCSRMPEMFAARYPFRFDVTRLRTDPDAAQQPPNIAIGSFAELGNAAKLVRSATSKLRHEAIDLDQRFDSEFVPAVEKWCSEQQAQDLAQLTDELLVGLWKSRCNKVMNEFGFMAFFPSMIEAFAISDLREFLDEYCWTKEPEAWMQRLVVCATLDQTMKSNMRLQEVGLGKRSEEQWMAKYGCRGPGEFDLSNPRWRERPADVTRMAKRLASEPPLGEHVARRQSDAILALDELRQSLTSAAFEELSKRLSLANRYVRFREDGKHHLMTAYAILRETALEFGRRLQINADVFMLEDDEMTAALLSGFVPQDRIFDRQSLRKAETSLSLPRVIDTQDLPTLGVVAVDKDAARWPAHVLSLGSCTSVARIVRSPETAGDLGTNYVLICPSTDPSWTPLFVGASGLILERGGALSHGAIVARELGLPAVVVEDATHLFQDGEMLTVDALRGQVARGVNLEVNTAESQSNDTRIERSLRPPPEGSWERTAAQYGLLAGLMWSALLVLMWCLPASLLYDPVLAIFDAMLWPLVTRLGMPGTVAVIAAFFAILPLLLQKLFTDNERVVTARDRASQLRKLARGLPLGSARRTAMEKLAAPVTIRVLKAAMTSLGFVLGPMIAVFLWLPARFDPASWNAAPGQMVTVLAEIQGDWSHPVELIIPAPLELDHGVPATQAVPRIRETLEVLRTDWTQRSEVKNLPWELQAISEHVNEAMQASLESYLASEIPSQKLAWRVFVSKQAVGHHRLKLKTVDNLPIEIALAFGESVPPVQGVVIPAKGPVYSLKVVYPRSVQKNVFFAPLGKISSFDFGWLGVYLLAYLPTMFLVKRLLRIA